MKSFLAVLTTRLLESLITVVSPVMFLSFLGVGFGFSGFIPEQYRSLLTLLFYIGCRSFSVWVPSKFLIDSFLCYYGVINFLSTGIVVSNFLSTEFYF